MPGIAQILGCPQDEKVSGGIGEQLCHHESPDLAKGEQIEVADPDGPGALGLSESCQVGTLLGCDERMMCWRVVYLQPEGDPNKPEQPGEYEDPSPSKPDRNARNKRRRE